METLWKINLEIMCITEYSILYLMLQILEMIFKLVPNLPKAYKIACVPEDLLAH